MDYKEFLLIVKKEMEENLGNEYGVIMTKVLKNNGMEHEALCIVKDLEPLVPAIYLYGYYEQMLHGKPLKELIDIILDSYLKVLKRPDINSSILNDFDRVKDNIVFQLINTDLNQDLLEVVPNLPYLDLSIVFHVLLEENQLGFLSVMIFDENVQIWKTDVNELYLLAMRNTPKLLPVDLCSVGTLIENFLKTQIINEELKLLMRNCESPFYILTNKFRRNGACAILYDELLANFANKIGEDIFILFISTDDVLLIPFSRQEDLNRLVNRRNQTNNKLPDDEIMTNKIYCFDRKNHKINQCSDDILTARSHPC